VKRRLEDLVEIHSSTSRSPQPVTKRSLIWSWTDSADTGAEEEKDYGEIFFTPQEMREQAGGSPSKQMRASITQTTPTRSKLYPNLPNLGSDDDGTVKDEDDPIARRGGKGNDKGKDDIFTSPRVLRSKTGLFHKAQERYMPTTPRAPRMPLPITPQSGSPLKRKFENFQNAEVVDPVEQVFTVLQRNNVDVSSFAEELHEILGRQARQKEGLYQGYARFPFDTDVLILISSTAGKSRVKR
jgi:hypothetical protein